QIDGDTATATIDGEVGELVREGGRWLIKSSSAENLFGGAGDDSGSMEGSSSGSSAEAPRPEDTLTPLDLGRPLRAEILPHESLFVGTWFSFSAPESGSYTVTVVGVDGTEESTDLVIESFLDGDYDTTIARS